MTAYVQYGDGFISGTLPSKQLLTFLSGVTNLFNVLQTITNVTVTNLTVNVADSPYLPSTNFPQVYDLTNDYVVTSGFFSYTNNSQFTNDIEFTQLTNAPVTYTFNNVVELTNGQSTYLFPNLQASLVTAVLSTNSTETNAIFALSGVVTNISTTKIYDVFPDFSKQRGAKLICVTPIQTQTILLTNGVTTNIVSALQKLYMVRYSIGKTVTNFDVSACFGEEAQSGTISTKLSSITLASCGLTRFAMDTTLNLFGAYPPNPGVTIDMTAGFDYQQSGALISKGKIVPIITPGGVIKARKLSGGGQGQVNGQIVNRTFNQATTLYNGSITFTGGHLENSL
jgi:hypothetical protein